MNKFAKGFEIFVLIALALTSIVISVLDFLNYFEAELVGIIPSLTLLSVGVTIIFLLIERWGKLESMTRLISEGFESVVGGQARSFDDTSEFYTYVSSRLKKANASVDDLTWGILEAPHLTKEQEQAFENYHKARVALVEKKDISIREVMSFPEEIPDTSKKRLERAKEMATKAQIGCQLRFFDYRHMESPPTLQFLIIDSREVILAYFGRGAVEVHVAVSHPETVRFFCDYYASIWSNAKVLKAAGEPINGSLVAQIEQRLASAPSP